MKKLLSILFILLMCLSLSACSKTEPAEEQENKNQMAGLPNPMVEYESLDAINDKTGTHLVKPAVMGVSDEKFFVINEKLADYDFKVNGIEYCFRASKDLSEDISGIYVDGNTIFVDMENVVDYYSDDTYKAQRFLIDDVQYTLVATDPENKLEFLTFELIATEMADHVCLDLSDPAVASLIGDYQDSTSQRAEASIDVIGKDYLLIDIQWGDSADSYDEWVIQVHYKDGKLDYSMGEIGHLHITNAADGAVEAVEVNDAIPGYFEVIDGKVCWTGSGVENTADCVFEKIG